MDAYLDVMSCFSSSIENVLIILVIFLITFKWLFLPYVFQERATTRFQLLPVSDLCQSLGPSSSPGPSSHSSGCIPLAHIPKRPDPVDLSRRVEWRSRAGVHLPAPLCEHCACVLHGVLYIAGGQGRYFTDGRHTTNAVVCFDPRRLEWAHVSSVPVYVVD